jgi:YidC/Oxa1 family membrane protein insertase
MKSDTKRVIATVAICMGILLVYTKFFVPDPAPAPAPQAQGAAGQAATPGAAAGGTGGAAGSSTGAAGSSAAAAEAPKPMGPPVAGTALPAAPVQRVPERKDVLETPEIRVELSNHGGSVVSYRLLGQQFQQGGSKGTPVTPLDLVTTTDATARPLRALLGKNRLEVPDDPEFQVASASPTEIAYVWEGPKARIEKRVRVAKFRYGLEVDVTIKNKGADVETAPVGLHVYGHMGQPSSSTSFLGPPPNVRMALCHAEDSLVEGMPEKLGAEPLKRSLGVRWAGVGDKYFLLGVVPRGAVPRSCEGTLSDPQKGVIDAALIEQTSVPAAGSATASYLVFGGPKFVKELDAVKVDGGDPMLGDAVNYGWLGPISRLLLALMLFFERVFGNWGIAIILLTIVVKLITLYPTQKSMRSMKEMARLKPELERLKKQYGDDKTRLNQEMMALYKQKGINPLGGCLPMLIQMPVWFALYSTLGNAVELYHSRFLWLTDLTQPDPYFIIPVVMGGCMFIQQKTAPQPADSEQQKMLMYVMPIMFTVFSLWFPAGLTVYILTNTLLTMAHQFWMNRDDPKKPAKKAAKA